MLNARKIQEFVIFNSRSFLKYPREAFSPLIYEYNKSMVAPILTTEKSYSHSYI